MYVHTRNYSGHFLNGTTESAQKYWIVEIFKIHATPHEMLFNLDPISLITFIKYLFFKLFEDLMIFYAYCSFGFEWPVKSKNWN